VPCTVLSQSSHPFSLIPCFPRSSGLHFCGALHTHHKRPACCFFPFCGVFREGFLGFGRLSPTLRFSFLPLTEFSSVATPFPFRIWGCVSRTGRPCLQEDVCPLFWRCNFPFFDLLFLPPQTTLSVGNFLIGCPFLNPWPLELAL